MDVGTPPRWAKISNGDSGSRHNLAEREGFEPPIGLHLCRISSAVHSTTLPPLQAPIRGDSSGPRSGRVLGEDGGTDKARGQDFRYPPGGAQDNKKEPKMEHLTVRANGAAFHVAKAGTGK